MTFESSKQIADSVLFEGYILYPYRASAAKNRVRWQFGVLAPRVWSERGGPEPWEQQTQCLFEADDEAVLAIRLRFLQVQVKAVEQPAEGGGFTPVQTLWVDGTELITFEEAVEQSIDLAVPVSELLGRPRRVVPVRVEGYAGEPEPVSDSTGALAARVVRSRQPLSAELSVSAERLDGPFGAILLTVRTENLTPFDGDADARKQAMSHSLVACHTLLALTPGRAGRFISLLEPPEWAKPYAKACVNLHTFPVMTGDKARADEVLSSPIILYDYPQIAPESPGDLFDATEIDEILILRTMTLTDEEKAEARATDPRAAEIIDRVDLMPPELMDRLHGAVRYLRGVTGEPEPADAAPLQTIIEGVPEFGTSSDGIPVFGEHRPFGEEYNNRRPAPSSLQDLMDEPSVNPDADSVEIGGVRVAKGDKVRLRPGTRRSDAQDMFLAGKIADVQAVFSDLENKRFLAVTLEEDINADLQVEHGRFLYFSPDEVEPIEVPA